MTSRHLHREIYSPTLNDNSDAPSLLLIGGLSRSGTSMLQQLFNNHPQMTITYEFRSFINTDKRFLEYYRGLRKNLWKGLTRRYTSKHTKTRKLSDFVFSWRFVFKILRRGHRKVSIAHIHETLQSLFPNATYVGDKYPSYLWHLSKLCAYDGIRIVIIYRDGRDVVQSILARVQTDWKDKVWAKKNLSTPTKIATRWVRAIETMEQYADQIYIIRYEDFVTNPTAELAHLAGYLNVDPAGFDHDQIKSSSVGRYKQMLTKEQIAEVVKIAGPTLERLGYIDDLS